MALIKQSTASFADRAKAAADYGRMHLEPAELQAFWAAVAGDAFWNGYFKLQYHFGCRCSEVAILLKQDIQLDGREILVRRLKKRVVGESLANGEGWTLHHYTDLPEKLITHLRAVSVPPKNPWFFGSAQRCHGKGEERVERMARIRIDDNGWRAVSRSTAQNHFQTLATAAGIPKALRHTHVLRHTRATLLFARGAGERDVQYVLSHSSPTITRKYIGWAAALKKRAGLAEMLAGEDDK